MGGYLAVSAPPCRIGAGGQPTDQSWRERADPAVLGVLSPAPASQCLRSSGAEHIADRAAGLLLGQVEHGFMWLGPVVDGPPAVEDGSGVERAEYRPQVGLRG